MKKLLPKNWQLKLGWVMVFTPIASLFILATLELIGWIASPFKTALSKAEQTWGLVMNFLTTAALIIPGVWLIQNHHARERVEVNINRIA